MNKKNLNKKNIIHYVTRQYMFMNKRRTFTAFIGIVFMVILMTCVFVGKDTSLNYLVDIAACKNGSWDIIAYDVTPEQYDRLCNTASVKEMRVSADGDFMEFDKSNNVMTPYISLRAYSDDDNFKWMNINLVEGRYPENDNEIVISKLAIEDGSDIKIGDEIKGDTFKRIISIREENASKRIVFGYNQYELKKGEKYTMESFSPWFPENEDFVIEREYAGNPKAYKVVGIIESPSYEKKDSAGYVAITHMDESEIIALDSFNVAIMLDYKKYEYSNPLDSVVNSDQLKMNNYVLAFRGLSSDGTVNILVKFMEAFFVVLIMLASVILIYNIFNMSFRERSVYIGMLSSVGATKKQRRSSVYYEAFMYLVFALPIGIIAGIATVWGGMQLIRPYMMTIIGSFMQVESTKVYVQIKPEALIFIVIASVITVLISAFLPARVISKVGPIESIKGNATIKKTYKLRKNTKNGISMVARNNVMRQKKKSMGIVLAATTCLTVLIASAFGSMIIHNIAQKEFETTGVDMAVAPNHRLLSVYANDEDEEAKKDVEQLLEEVYTCPNIKAVKERGIGVWMLGCKGEDFFSDEYYEDMRQVVSAYQHKEVSVEETKKLINDYYAMLSVIVLDEETLKQLSDRIGADYECLNNMDKPGVIIVDEGHVSTSEYRFEGKVDRSKYFDIEHISKLNVGDTLDYNIYSQKEEKKINGTLQIAGTVKNKDIKDIMEVKDTFTYVIVSPDFANSISEIMGAGGYDNLFSTAYDLEFTDVDCDLNDKLLELASDDNMEGLSVSYIDKPYSKMIHDVVDSVVKALDTVLICFVIIVSVICIFNLVNSIDGRIADRKKEFAMLISVGMEKGQMIKMLMLENIYIVGASVLLSAVIAIFINYFLRVIVNSFFGNLIVAFPITLSVTSVLVVCILIYVITIISIKKENITDIIDNIRKDIV